MDLSFQPTEYTFRAIIEASPYPVYLCTGEKMIISLANPATLKAWGKDISVIGKTFEEALPELNGQPFLKLLKNVYSTGIPYHSGDERADISISGELKTFYFNFTYQPYKNEQGVITGVFCFATDVTELVQARIAVEDGKTNLYNLIVQAPVAICIIKGSPFKVDIVNDSFLDLSGKSRDEFEQKPFWEVMKEAADFYQPLTEKVFTTGITYRGEEHQITLTRNGIKETIYVDFVYEAIKDAHGAIDAVMMVGIEVTDKVLARRKIEESEARFHQLVIKSPFIMLVLKGPEFMIEIANQALFDYWRKTPEETIGRNLLDVLPELRDQPFPQILNRVFESGIPYGEEEVTNQLEMPEGFITKYVTYLYEPILDRVGNVTGILVAAEDKTREVEARLQVKASEESLRLAITAAELGMFDMDLINNTMYWDQRCRELFGISHNEKVTYEDDFLPGLHPDDRETISRTISEYVYNKNLSNGDYDVEYRTVGITDKKLRWVRAKGKTFFNEKDEPVRFTGTVLDITEQKLAENRKNEFFSIASHELKTPLTSAKSYIQVLLAKVKQEDDGFKIESLTRVEKQINKMTNMVQNFLNNAKIIEGKLDLKIESFNIDDLLREVIYDMTLSAQTHEFKLVDCDAISVNADRERIAQVLENLLSNAVKYSAKDSLITLKCDLEDKQAVISVSDQGIGISSQHQEKLFDRFYRVDNEKIKNVSGFGIGLYLVAEILRFHESRILVESTPNVGSKFYFNLPISNV